MAEKCTPVTITVDGAEYVKKSDLHADSPVKIVILQRGWVMVGRWSRDGDNCTLDDASVIERWGTTKGLGELVDGPTENTKLAPCGHVEFHILGVVAAISADESKW